MKKQYALSKWIFCLLCAITLVPSVKAQPFIDEIIAFKKNDSIAMPQKNAILFVGSSSFRMWTNVKQDFPLHSIINRGFGGSSLTDVIRYADQIIFPYQPAQILIYAGENDLASADTVSAQMINDRFQQLFKLIRIELPDVAIAFVSIKPSPSRQHLLQKVIAANDLIKNFLTTQTKAAYIDVFSAMIDEKKNPLPDLFIEDRLHMNKKGYAIWLQIIYPHLLKN